MKDQFIAKRFDRNKRRLNRLAAVERLECRQLLSVSLGATYTGTLTLSKALPGAQASALVSAKAKAPSAAARRVEFDLTVTGQSPDGEVTGDLSAGPLGTFAFDGTSDGKTVELIFEGEQAGAGVLTATLSRAGNGLSGRWSSTINSQRITGNVRASSGGTPVAAGDAPAAVGQSAVEAAPSRAFASVFNGTATIAGAGSTSTSTGTTTGNTPNSGTTPATGPITGATGSITGSIGAIGGAAGSVSAAGSNGAITGSSGAITGSTGAITGSTGAINGGIGTVTPATGTITGMGPGSDGAIAGTTGAISGGIGTVNVASTTAPITGSTGAITGTGGVFMGGFTGAIGSAGTVAPTTPTSTPSTTSEPVVLTVVTETHDGLVTGTLSINGTAFNFDGYVTGNQFNLVMSGPGSGHAEGTLLRGRSVFRGTFSTTAGGASSSGTFTAQS